MFFKNNKIISVLDIGSTKIVCIIAKITKKGVEVISVGSNASEGIRCGIVADVKLFRTRVAAAVHEAEQKAKKHIDIATINLANPLIKSHFTKVVTQFNGKQILIQDLTRIERKALGKVDVTKNDILYSATLWHDVDEMTEIFDPEFMFANTMVSYLNFVTIPVKYIINLTSSLLGCQIKISNMYMNAYAAAISCASEDEMKEGCIVADIGGETLDYAIIKNNTVVDIGCIPFGGKIITSDIASYFNISIKEAEKAKILHGQLFDFAHDADLVKVVDDHDHDKQIRKADLNEVISARFEEIISVFLSKISKHMHIANSIIFTGGSSKIIGLQDFIQRNFNLSSRIGAPIYVHVSGDESDIETDPTMSVALGLLKLSTSEAHAKSITKNKRPSVGKALSWLKDNF